MNLLNLLPGISGETEALAARVSRSVVQIRGRRGAGSGIVWRADGMVVTNHHVVPEDAASIEMSDGAVYPGSVVARDQANDLAIVRVEAPEPLPAAAPGDSRALRVGQFVLALGNPWGQRNVLTAGVISAVTKDERSRELLKADITLAPGNSGGPLLDSEGRVLGVNSMIASPGIALAVPTHVVRRLTGDGAPKLGIGGRDAELPAPVAASAGARVGILLTEVAADSLADRAGLFVGDVIVRHEGRPVEGSNHFARLLADRDGSLPVRLTVLRGGVARDVSVPAAA